MFEWKPQSANNALHLSKTYWDIVYCNSLSHTFSAFSPFLIFDSSSCFSHLCRSLLSSNTFCNYFEIFTYLCASVVHSMLAINVYVCVCVCVHHGNFNGILNQPNERMILKKINTGKNWNCHLTHCHIFGIWMLRFCQTIITLLLTYSQLLSMRINRKKT